MDKTTAYNYIRSKFVGIRETRRLIKEHSLKIKYGYLSEEESKTVRDVVDKFLKERSLTLNDLKKHLVEDTEFPIHDLLYECTSACELRTYKSIHTHISYMYHPYIRMDWNEEEEMQLLDLVNQKGFKWKEISYHITKYKDICRLKYLAIKGELTRQNLTNGMMQGLLSNMPSTDEEWEVLCTQLKMPKTLILRLVNRYLNGKELIKAENKIHEISLCLSILNHNHYCKFNVNIFNIVEFLNSEHDIFERIDGKSTPFISKKGKREGSVLVGGVFQRHSSSSCSSNNSNNSSTNTNNTNNNINNNINNNSNNNNINDEDAHFEQILENIKKATKENNIQTKFLNKFLDFFKLSENFNLNIDINKDDIFWFNVCRETVLEKSTAVKKFNQMRVTYGWKRFQDIYDTIIKISYDYVVLKIKERLIVKKQKQEEETIKIDNNSAIIENIADNNNIDNGSVNTSIDIGSVNNGIIENIGDNNNNIENVSINNSIDIGSINNGIIENIGDNNNNIENIEINNSKEKNASVNNSKEKNASANNSKEEIANEDSPIKPIFKKAPEPVKISKKWSEKDFVKIPKHS